MGSPMVRAVCVVQQRKAVRTRECAVFGIQSVHRPDRASFNETQHAAGREMGAAMPQKRSAPWNNGRHAASAVKSEDRRWGAASGRVMKIECAQANLIV